MFYRNILVSCAIIKIFKYIAHIIITIIIIMNNNSLNILMHNSYNIMHFFLTSNNSVMLRNRIHKSTYILCITFKL